jgi:hypothetical protein
MTKIDNGNIQDGRYYPDFDNELSYDEKVEISKAMHNQNFKTLEEEWNFRNGFVAFKKFALINIQKMIYTHHTN